MLTFGIAAPILSAEAIAERRRPVTPDLGLAPISSLLFHDLCVSKARDNDHFFAFVGKNAQRKMSKEQYQALLPDSSKGDAVFYDVQVPNTKDRIAVGRVEYQDHSINCLVAFRDDGMRAGYAWHYLYATKYKSEVVAGEDKTGPYYMFHPGRDTQVLVQSSKAAGWAVYYSFFR